jgi:imidazole glycerol-phosphate synthase subunit HisH
MIGIINYGMGNLRSVQKAFERINVPVFVTDNPSSLNKADKIILPGVGHFEQGMNNLRNSGFKGEILEAVTVKNKPILGICLGMQLLTEHSEEGNVDGLGLVKGKVIHFPDMGLKIPHMGWNTLIPKKSSELSSDISLEILVYFVHSYYVKCEHSSDILFQTNYGFIFDSAFQHENIIGFQFHPEKSHKTGLKLLDQFYKL